MRPGRGAPAGVVRHRRSVHQYEVGSVCRELEPRDCFSEHGCLLGLNPECTNPFGLLRDDGWREQPYATRPMFLDQFLCDLDQHEWST